MMCILAAASHIVSSRTVCITHVQVAELHSYCSDAWLKALARAARLNYCYYQAQADRKLMTAVNDLI